MENTSSKYQINSTDLYKVFRGFLITLLGAGLTFASKEYLNVSYSFTYQGHLIDLTFIAVPAIGSLIEAGRRWLTDFSSR